jgi:hypothetical protein
MAIFGVIVPCGAIFYRICAEDLFWADKIFIRVKKPEISKI